MDGFSRSGEARPSPQLLDLVSKERDWFPRSCGSSDENKLELTLGLPGENRSSLKLHGHIKTTCNEKHEALLSLGTMMTQKISSLNDHSGDTKLWPSSAKFLQFPSNAAAAQDLSVVGKESLKHCSSTKMVQLQTRNNNNDDAAAAAEKQGFLQSADTHTAVPNTSQSQKRTAPAPAPAPAPVVGWPPIRSFRKNLASTSIKPSTDTQNEKHDKVTTHGKRASIATPNSIAQGLFVKINMDGIPIGRKVDLNAYDNYEKLSIAVDKLFRGLLAVQTGSFSNGIPCNIEEEKPIMGLLDGSGEYTLVYDDNEGDRVLVGDVPWRMFVSTVKRLRVLKTSDIPSLSLGSKKQKMQLESPQ